MPTTTFFKPGERFQFRQGTREQNPCGGRRRLAAQLRRNSEPEQSLWKLSMEAVSPKFAKVGLIAFLFLGVLVSAATVCSFSELVHLVNSGALEQTVQALLTK
jgi:hypothetical protein